ncbi:autotransporter outer membrane beta-barrel domain-containing protein [Legionella sp.]|uniref:autotransporter outer membrane beta-barrel domain-containing protein n=1 Tax=Legionella sp. TaxID=459 RepID=UPI003CBCF2DF
MQSKGLNKYYKRLLSLTYLPVGILLTATSNVQATDVSTQAELDAAVASQANPINIIAGNLELLGAQTFAIDTDLSVAAGASLSVANTTQIIGSLSGQGTIFAGTQLLVAGVNNTDTVFSGIISLTAPSFDNPHGEFAKIGTGTMTIDNATISMGAAFIAEGAMAQTSGTTIVDYLGVGEGTGAVGALNVSGGTITFGTSLQVGNFRGQGVVNQTGGNVMVIPTCGSPANCSSLNIGNQGGTGVYNISGGQLTLSGLINTLGRSTGTNPGSTGTLNISGGLVDVINGANLIIGFGNASATEPQSLGIINQTGGTLYIDNSSFLFLTGQSSSMGIYNLNGGTLEIGGGSLRAGFNISNLNYQFNLGGGTIQVIGASLASSVDATLMPGTVSTIDTNGLNATWGGILSGGGGFAKNGAGTFTLNGTSNYSGTTSVNAGTFQANAVNVLSPNSAFTIASGATLDLNNFNNTIASFAGAGNITVGSATLTSGNNNSSTTFSGIISGTGGLIKNGDGILTLTGDSASFTGATQVNNGILVLNNTLGGNLNMAASTTLQGNGASGSPGSTAIINGHIQPGDSSVGTLTFNGNYIQTAGSVYEMEVVANQYNFIHVLGSATLNNSAQISLLNGSGPFSVNTTVSILHAEEGVTGQYNPSILEINRPFLDLVLSYGPNDVYLSVLRNSTSFNSFVITPNQIAVANAIDSLAVLAPQSPLYSAVANLTSPQQVQAAFNSLSGQIHAAAHGAYVEESRYIRDAVLNRLYNLDNESPASSGNNTHRWIDSDLSGNNTHWWGDSSLSDNNTHGWSNSGLWMEGYGTWGEIGTPSSNTASLNRSNRGLFIGTDALLLKQWRAGIVSGFGETNLSMRALSSNGNSDNAYIGFYTSTQAEKLTGYLGVTYAWHHLNTKRFVVFPGVADILHSTYQAPVTQVFGEVGYDLFSHSNYNFKPFVQIAYVDANNEFFNESGGISALTGFKTSEDVLYSVTGVRLNTHLGDVRQVAWQARALVGWQYAYRAINPISAFSFIGSSPFFITGVPIARNAALIDAAIDAGTYNDNLHFTLGYLGQLSNKVQDNGLQGSISWRFA